ncbi:MAG: DUF3565 domain-containing protein [Acidobacteriota bacterium]
MPSSRSFSRERSHHANKRGSILKRKIVSFHQDEQRHWVADLECGHQQHVRHDPPLTRRLWVLTVEGRKSRIGGELDCKKCDELPQKGLYQAPLESN